MTEGIWRQALTALVISAFLSGCSIQFQLGDLGEAAGGDPGVAARMVDHWFDVAKSGEEDSGWTLLHPTARDDLIGSIDVYRAAVAGIDWSGFDYDVVGGRLSDGKYHIDVRVAGGRASVPEPMCRWGMLQLTEEDADDGSNVGLMQVRIPPLGNEPAGILVGGRSC